MEAHTIKTVSGIAGRLGAQRMTIRTLAIEHEVPFVAIGNSWIFQDPDAHRLEAIYADHLRKEARALGREPDPVGAA